MPDAAANWVAWLGTCFAIGAVGTWLARRYALRRQLVDLPGDRRSHSIPTPRGGGVAIVATLLFGIGWLLAHPSQDARFLWAFGAGCVLISGIGWIDDHRPLSPWVRLAVQAMAAALLAWGLDRDGAGAMPATIGFVAAMVLTNVWNFMDGIDGIATTQAILVAFAYGVVAWGAPQAGLAFALAAGCLGFLPFNFPKARIFLGDVGSGTLGYGLAGLAAWIGSAAPAHSALLLLPLSPFLIDASWTLLARIVRGERWWLPHAEHAYQYWARHSGSHAGVTFTYAGWTFLASLFMFRTRIAAPAFIIPLVVGVFVAGSAIWACSRWAQQRDEAAPK